MAGYSMVSMAIFSILRDEIVDPYRQSKGLELPELLFSHRGTEFLISDTSGSEAKEIIRITRPLHPDNVKVINNNYLDLGEQLREKLNELKERELSLYA